MSIDSIHSFQATLKNGFIFRVNEDLLVERCGFLNRIAQIASTACHPFSIVVA
jgi:hypothetical protein